MFDGVAQRYDLTNDVLSLGQTRLWRRAVARAVDARPGERVLDLAAGTGSSSLPFAQAGAQVVAGDFSLGMLQVGKRAHPTLDLLAGDALRLPFADRVFDAVTISFGLRNVADIDAGARRDGPGHPARRPAGRLRVQPPDLAPVPHRVLRLPDAGACPRSPGAVASNPDAYVYLAESIRAWPDQPALAQRIAAAGWTRRRLAEPHRGHRGAAPRAPPDGVSRVPPAARGRSEHDLTSMRTGGHGCRRQDQEQGRGDHAARPRRGSAAPPATTSCVARARGPEQGQPQAGRREGQGRLQGLIALRPDRPRSEGPVRQDGPLGTSPGRTRRLAPQRPS